MALVLGLGVAGSAMAAVAVYAIRRMNAERRPAPIDPAVVVAISASVASLHPGARVTRIEAEP